MLGIELRALHIKLSTIELYPTLAILTLDYNKLEDMSKVALTIKDSLCVMARVLSLSIGGT